MDNATIVAIQLAAFTTTFDDYHIINIDSTGFDDDIVV